MKGKKGRDVGNGQRREGKVEYNKNCPSVLIQLFFSAFTAKFSAFLHHVLLSVLFLTFFFIIVILFLSPFFSSLFLPYIFAF